MKFAYRKEFATEALAAALEKRGWNAVASNEPWEELLAGNVHVIMTPALEYGKHLGLLEYALVPGMGIVTQGLAGLIKVVFNKGLKDVETMAVKHPAAAETDIASLVLSEKHQLTPQAITVDAAATIDEMLATADCALLVGDDALFGMGNHTTYLDITDEWQDVTESPLPYMLMWGPLNAITQRDIETINAARDEAILTLADRAATHPQPVQANAFYAHYLQGDIQYALAPDDTDVLNSLFHYAFYHTIITDIPSIKFLPEGEPIVRKPERGASDATKPDSAPPTG